MLRRSVLLALVGLAACEFPTEPPKWDQTWVVPGESITVSVAELLPASVGLTADSSAFVAETPGSSISFSLGDLCSACGAANGFEVPKPEFTDTLETTSTLPADLVSATLAGGSLNAAMSHTFNFDPLRPSQDAGNPRGYLVIRVTSSGNVVASDSIHGDDTAFPTGTTLTPELTVQPVQVADSLAIEIILYSPQGDPVTIDTSDTLGVAVATATLEISEATVNASSVTIDPTTTSMDFGGVDSTLVERIQSGALLFDIENPFSITGTLDVAFQGTSFAPIQRSLAINQGTYADSIAFNGTELRSILGSDAVDVVTSGSVGAPGGTVTVTPTQRLVLENEFKLVVLIGPTEDL